MEGVGSVGAWVRRWRESNFGIGLVGPQNFGEDKKKMAEVEILVWMKHDFMNFRYNTMMFYLRFLYFLCILCTCCIVMNFHFRKFKFMFYYFHKKTLFPEIKSLNQYLKFH